MSLAALVLDTGRLLLRPIAAADDDALAAAAGSRDIADTMISVPHPMTLAIAREWIERESASMHRGTAVMLAIRERADDSALLGAVSLRHMDREHACAELSFWLAPGVNGRGYATEAAAALVEHGFTELALNRIEAYHMVRNPASARVLSRLGFQLEGTLRERVIKWGTPEDVRLWSRLRAR